MERHVLYVSRQFPFDVSHLVGQSRDLGAAPIRQGCDDKLGKGGNEVDEGSVSGERFGPQTAVKLEQRIPGDIPCQVASATEQPERVVLLRVDIADDPDLGMEEVSGQGGCDLVDHRLQERHQVCARLRDPHVSRLAEHHDSVGHPSNRL